MTATRSELFERLLEQHAERPHPGLSAARLRLHVTMHVVAETQIASGEPPATAQALERLIAEGLDRHEAVHAICSVIADELLSTLEASRYDEGRFSARLAALDARTWCAQGTVPGAR